MLSNDSTSQTELGRFALVDGLRVVLAVEPAGSIRYVSEDGHEKRAGDGTSPMLLVFGAVSLASAGGGG